MSLPHFPSRPASIGAVPFALAVTMLIWLACAVASAADTPRRPNILLIYTDDQSYKTVGCYPGHYPWAKTPNIDRLAAEGVRFAGAYLGSWCMPSRASILTGRHPHGIESMQMKGEYPGATYDPEKCRFWPSVLRKNGYQTAQIGKWHTGADAGYGRDWDHQIVWNRPKHPENAGAYYEKQLLAFNGVERKVDGYSTDNYSRWACDYIRGEHRDAEKPWFLWLCYGAVHGPSHPAARHRGMYADVKVPVPADIFPPRPGKPRWLEEVQSWAKGPNGEIVIGKSGEKFDDAAGNRPKTFEAFVRQMNECVPAIDEGVGQIVAALKESGQWESTLVVFTSDQGFALGEHGFRTKLGPWDANYRSPLIVRMPGVTQDGKTSPEAANAPDLVATFLKTADVAQPWTVHGEDLTPLLKDPENARRQHPLLFTHFGQHFGSDVTEVLKKGDALVHSGVPWWVAVRDGRYKYIRTLLSGEQDELYDLDADPEELDNLALQPPYQAQRERMRSLLTKELRRTVAEFVESLPAIGAAKAE